MQFLFLVFSDHTRGMSLGKTPKTVHVLLFSSLLGYVEGSYDLEYINTCPTTQRAKGSFLIFRPNTNSALYYFHFKLKGTFIVLQFK